MKILHVLIRHGLLVLMLLMAAISRADDGITILYDAFGREPGLQKDWGFAALIQYQGKRILFDTGDNADIFAHNVNALNVNLADLDFAVISHRHSDHISGIPYLLQINPKLKQYKNAIPVQAGMAFLFVIKGYSGPIRSRFFGGIFKGDEQ